VDPVLCREVEEREQLLLVAGDLGNGLVALGTVGGSGLLDRLLGVPPVLGVADLRGFLGGGGLGRFLQAVQHVDRLVHPAAAVPGVGEYFGQRCPEPQCAVADRQHRGAHAAAAGIAQRPGPGFGGPAVPVGEGDQFLVPVGAHR
jgi:hypothetical protein